MNRPGRIDLPADLGIESLAALRGRLASKRRNRRAVRLDGSAVARVHAASLQLLCAFANDRAADGRETRLENPSAALGNAIRLTGTAALLGADPPEARTGA